LLASEWEAYYWDGALRVYTSRETAWVALPPTGLVAVTELRPTGRTIYNGGDWYWLHDGAFGYTPSQAWDAWEPAPTFACASCVKQGITVDDEVFADVIERAYGRL